MIKIIATLFCFISVSCTQAYEAWAFPITLYKGHYYVLLHTTSNGEYEPIGGFYSQSRANVALADTLGNLLNVRKIPQLVLIPNRELNAKNIEKPFIKIQNKDIWLHFIPVLYTPSLSLEYPWVPLTNNIPFKPNTSFQNYINNFKNQLETFFSSVTNLSPPPAAQSLAGQNNVGSILSHVSSTVSHLAQTITGSVVSAPFSLSSPLVQKYKIPSFLEYIATNKQIGGKSGRIKLFEQDVDQNAQNNATIPSKTSDFVRIATYNVHGWKNASDNPNYGQIIDVLKQINADILVLQEVTWFTDNQLNTLKTTFNDMGYKNFQSMPIAGATDNRSNMLLTKLHSTDLQKKTFLTQYDGEKRNYLSMNFDIKGNRFIVYGTHLAHTIDAEQVRAQQIKEIIAADFPKTIPSAIIAGDFNAHRQRDYQYTIFQQSSWDIFQKDFRNYASQNPYNYRPLTEEMINYYQWKDAFDVQKMQRPFTVWSGLSVDYLLLSPTWDLPIKGVYAYFTAASDHIPLIIDLNIPVS